MKSTNGRRGWGRGAAGFALGAVTAAAVLAGCGGGSSSGSGSGITLYNGQHPQTTAALVREFQKETGIPVHVRNDDEDVLANQIVEEGGHSPADVILAENSPALQVLAEKHLLARTDPATLAAVPSRFDSPQGYWVGVSARIGAFAYNTAKVSAAQLPRSVMDLAGPQWKGRLGLAPSETDFQPVVTAVADRYGRAAALKWLEGLKANAASHIYPDNETLVSEVDKGAVSIGVIDHYYWYRQQAVTGVGRMHSALGYFAPGDPGYLLDVSGAGVLSSSGHRSQAQRFLAFLVGPAAQAIIASSDSFEYPLRPGVAANPALKPLSALSPADLGMAQLGDGTEAVNLLQQAQLL